MLVLLRSDNAPDVGIAATQYEYCNIEKLDQHIRTLLAARRWMKAEQARKAKADKK